VFGFSLRALSRKYRTGEDACRSTGEFRPKVGSFVLMKKLSWLPYCGRFLPDVLSLGQTVFNLVAEHSSTTP